MTIETEEEGHVEQVDLYDDSGVEETKGGAREPYTNFHKETVM